jgi:hypothetical protein
MLLMQSLHAVFVAVGFSQDTVGVVVPASTTELELQLDAHVVDGQVNASAAVAHAALETQALWHAESEQSHLA